MLDEFYTWIGEITPKTLPQNLLGKAITYVQNQKEYLSNFLLGNAFTIAFIGVVKRYAIAII